MDLQKIYADSDFQNAVVPEGQILVFNGVEDGKPVTRYKDSSGNFGTISGTGVEITLGQINETGAFQALAFNGTEVSADGEPETVESYYGWNGVLPSPSGGIKVYNIGDAAYYKCASVDTVNKTWAGYKAVLTGGVYSFEEAVTEGLTYGTAFTPVISKVYDACATILVTKLWDGVVIPTNGLLLYVPLDSTPITASTGQEIALNGDHSVLAGSLGGIKNCSFSSTYAEVTPVTDFPTGDDERTVSAWVYATDVNTRQTIFCYGANARNQTWSFELRSGKISVSGAADAANEGYSIGSVSANSWHHLAVVHRDSTDHFYLDGEGIGSFAYERNTGSDLCYIGTGSDALQMLPSNTYITALRFYNRALSDDELMALASEFTL